MGERLGGEATSAAVPQQKQLPQIQHLLWWAAAFLGFWLSQRAAQKMPENSGLIRGLSSCKGVSCPAVCLFFALLFWEGLQMADRLLKLGL